MSEILLERRSREINWGRKFVIAMQLSGVIKLRRASNSSIVEKCYNFGRFSNIYISEIFLALKETFLLSFVNFWFCH